MEYPIYRKDIGHFYKVISKDLIIRVFKNGFSDALDIAYTDNNIMVNRVMNEDISTESEFIDAYNEVKNKLEDLVLKS